MTRNRYHIVWILLLAAILRFIQIGAPPVGRHAWRQSDTASVARNFQQIDHRLLFPQIDWEVPGYVEMEFPVFPWTAAALSGPIGGTEVTARSLAVLGALVTLAFLYLLVARILGRRAGLWAAFLYSVLPANLFFGRAIMPESWMLAASAAAMYCFVRWIDDDSPLFYLLALIATTLACLLKLTNLYLGLPLLWLAWRKWGRGTPEQGRLWLFAALVTTGLILWYGHAYRLGEQFGASFHILTGPGTDKWGTWGLLVDPGFYERVFLGYLGGRILTWAGLLLFVLGLAMRRLSARERLFDLWLLAVVVVLLLASGGSYQHDYYSLPIALPAVVFMAKVFDRGWQRRRVWLAAAVLLILILSGYRHAGALADERQPGGPLLIAEALAAQTNPGDLVISCNGANPVWLYLAQRRGWGRECEDLEKPELAGLIARGARYLVLEKAFPPSPPVSDRLTTHLRAFYQVAHEDETLILFRLGAPTQSEDLTWAPLHEERFRAAIFLETLDIHGGWWRPEKGALVGTRIRKPARASTREALSPCRVCRVRMSVSLDQPPPRRRRQAGRWHHRGSGRTKSQASIDLWWRDPGTGITLTLATQGEGITLQQFEAGELVGARTVDVPLADRRRVKLELRYDAFDFEVLVGGHSILQTESRLTFPMAGGLTLRPQLGSIRLHQFDMWVPTKPREELRRIDFETGRLD